MPDLDDRFASLMTTRAPDLWRDIELREPRSSRPTASPGRRLVAAIVALGVAVAGTLTVVRAFEGSGSRPLTAPGAGRIVFSADGGGEQIELFSMNPDGSDVRQLTDTPVSEEEPAWSPDGTRIAFAIREPEDTTSYVIGVMDADGSNRGEIAATRLEGRTPVASPAWSPDGREIAFAAYGEGGGIYVAPLIGGSPRQLTSAGPPTTHVDSEPEWSPNRESIVFIRWILGDVQQGNEYQILRIDADGGEPTVLATFPGSGSEPHELGGLSWSPDGSRLAFTTRGGVYLLDPTNREAREIVACEALGCDDRTEVFTNATSWSPDGLHIAFTAWLDLLSGRADPPIIHVATLSGDDEVTVASTGVGGLFPAWQPVLAGESPSPIPSLDPEPLPAADPRIAASIPVGPQGNTSAILYAERSVWVTASFVDGGGGVDRSMLFRIDASTNAIVAEIPLEGAPTFVSGGGGLAYGFGSVWVAGYGRVDGSLQAIAQRVDPTSNAVTASIPLGGSHGADIAVDERSVWAAYFADDHAGVARIDPATNSVIADTALPSSYVRRITAAGGGVVATELEWAENEGPCMVLTAIDPVTATISAREPLGPGCGGMQLFVWNDEIWASGAGLQRVDPSTAQLVGEPVTFEPEHSPRSFVLGTEREVWFGAYPGGNGNRPDHLARLDPASGAIEYFIEAGGTDAVFAPETRTIWILEFDGSLTRVDLNDR
jgi:Tol biopolymer transport system component